MTDGKTLRLVGMALLALMVIVPSVACTTNYNVRVITMASDEEARDLYLKIALPTVLVRAESGTGSGVVFGDGSLVLTAAHVVTSYEPELDMNGEPKRDGSGRPIFKPVVEKAVVFKNEGLVPFVTGVEVVKINHDLDLAVLKLAQVYPYAKAKFASADPELYQKCWASGHPHGVTDPMVTEGRVQDLWEDGFILYSAPTTFGNSGGPIFVKVGKDYFISSVVQRVFVEGFGIAVNHMGLGALPVRVREFVEEFSH